MTAPNQKIFNPNLFKAPAQEQESEPQENSGGGGKKDYPVTGNAIYFYATRDQVRKLIFESFQGDNPTIPGEKLSISQAVEVIECSILNESKDPKSKQYRDKSRQVQLKLKGPRYEQSRNELRTGVITSEDFIKDEYVQGKAAATAAPNQMQQRVGSAPMMPPGGGGFAQRPPIMGGGGPRPMMPMGMMRPPGPGGPMVRPRMMAPPAFKEEINLLKSNQSNNYEKSIHNNKLNRKFQDLWKNHQGLLISPSFVTWIFRRQAPLQHRVRFSILHIESIFIGV